MYIEIISKIYKSVKITICLCVEIKLKMLYNIGNISWKGIMEIKEIKNLRNKKTYLLSIKTNFSNRLFFYIKVSAIS